jgi:Fe-S cluster assembly iron-binding protein IscA
LPKHSPTTTIAPAGPRPTTFVEITAEARDGLRLIADKQNLGEDWSMRLEVVWKPDAQIEVTIDRKPPSDRDHVINTDGLRVVMAEDQKVYLKGSRVDLFWAKGGAGFNVTFPHRDERDRELASKWLKEQNEKRKNEVPGKSKGS